MTLRASQIPPFLVGLGLGVFVAGAWFLAQGSAAPKTVISSAPTASKQGAPPVDESGALSVSAQSAGMSVLIDSITVPPPGVWVAVRDVAADGTLGNILGAARAHGPASAFLVPLLRATEPGTRYAVMLYRENGDGVFDPATDSVYVDFDSGVRVVQYFTTAP